MKKYLLIYSTPASVLAQLGEATEEQMKEGMKVWYEWQEKLGDKCIDLGAPMSGSELVTPAGISELQSTRSGYSIVQAADKAEAMSLLEGHPHLGWHPEAKIEVFECADV